MIKTKTNKHWLVCRRVAVISSVNTLTLSTSWGEKKGRACSHYLQQNECKIYVKRSSAMHGQPSRRCTDLSLAALLHSVFAFIEVRYSLLWPPELLLSKPNSHRNDKKKKKVLTWFLRNSDFFFFFHSRNSDIVPCNSIFFPPTKDCEYFSCHGESWDSLQPTPRPWVQDEQSRKTDRWLDGRWQ